MFIFDRIQNKLIKAIKESGMTESEIAEKIGVSYLLMHQFCIKRKIPALDTFSKLCKILELDSNEILCLYDKEIELD